MCVHTHRHVSSNAKLSAYFPLILQEKFGLDCIWFGRLLKVLVVTSPSGPAGRARSHRCPSLVQDSEPCCIPSPPVAPQQRLGPGLRVLRAQAQATQRVSLVFPSSGELLCGHGPDPGWHQPNGSEELEELWVRDANSIPKQSAFVLLLASCCPLWGLLPSSSASCPAAGALNREILTPRASLQTHDSTQVYCNPSTGCFATFPFPLPPPGTPLASSPCPF